MHIHAKNEHVGIIEWSICTIKKHARATFRAISFKKYTSLITGSLIKVLVELLNSFLSKDGMSDTLCPSTIVEGRPESDMGHKKIAFGSYLWFTLVQPTLPHLRKSWLQIKGASVLDISLDETKVVQLCFYEIVGDSVKREDVKSSD